MDLPSYLRVLRRRKMWILLAAVMAVTGTMGGRMLLPPASTAIAVVRVTLNPSGHYAAYTQAALVERLMNTCARIAASEGRLAALRQSLGVDEGAPQEIEVQPVPDTELLSITVRDRDPALALEAAGELARQLVENPARGTRIQVVDAAHLQKATALDSVPVRLGLALLSGIAAGMGMAFVADQLDPRLISSGQAAATGAGIVGEIPEAGKRGGRLLETESGREAFQRLCLNLLAQAGERQQRVLLVTSPGPGEGKSTVAANIAATMRLLGHKAAILRANPDRQASPDPFSEPDQALPGPGSPPGQNEGAGRPAPVCPQADAPLFDCPAGLPDTAGLAACLEELKDQFDLVLIDSPAFLESANAAALATLADGALLVVRLGRTREPELRAALEQLANLRCRLTGLVANRVRTALPGSYDRYGTR